MTPWREFFDVHGPRHMDEPFTAGTVAEADSAECELGPIARAHVLDVGCGICRHSVELARRGYPVTGSDLSAGMLAPARAAGVKVRWVQADATDFSLDEQADAALYICEGAFSLLGAADDASSHDPAVLRCMRRALAPGAPFRLSASSALRVAGEVAAEDVAAGPSDPLTSVEIQTLEYGEAGERRSVGRERLYMPVELTKPVADAGFALEHVGGDTAGLWARRPLDLDEYETMVLARREADREGD